MKTKVVQHVPRINICISHITCDMCKAKCDMCHNYKYTLLSLHMKTKVVQHVPRINIGHVTCEMWHNYKYSLWHENKNCSACAKDQHKHVTGTVTVTVTDTVTITDKEAVTDTVTVTDTVCQKHLNCFGRKTPAHQRVGARLVEGSASQLICLV